MFKTSSKRLQDVSKTVFNTTSRRLQDLSRTSSRHLQDVLQRYIQDVFKMFSRRLQGVFKMSYEDVFKTSSKRLQDVSKTVFKTSSIRLQDVSKTSSRHLQDVLQRYLQDVFKTCHQVKLFLLTRFGEALNTFLRRSFSKTVIYREICLSNTTSDKFMVSVPSLQER